MKSFFRKIFFASTLLSLVFSLALSASAQISSNNDYPDIMEVYVKDIKINDDSLESGDTIDGSFILHNNMKVSVTNVYYELRTGGEYGQDGLPKIFYGSKSFGPISLAPGEKKNISFAYDLPANISGDLGLRVKAYLESGNPLGFGDARIKVAGQNRLVSVGRNYIKVGTKTFGLSEGPTLSPAASGTLSIDIFPSAGLSVLNPEVNIYDRSIYGSKIGSIDLEKIKLNNKPATTTITFNLPKFDNNPGVYVGVLRLLDEDRSVVSPDITFRYIVGGPIFTINSVSLDKQSIKSGEDLNLTIWYSGAPEDIVSNKNEARGDYDLEISVLSESGQNLATYNGKIVDPGEGGTSSYKLVSAGDADSLFVSVVVKNGSDIISQYQAEMPKAQDDKSLIIEWKNILFTILGVLILIAVLFLKSKNKKIIAVLSLFLLLSLLSSVDSAYAWPTISTSGSYVPNVSPNDSPVANSGHNPGAVIGLSGTVYQNACSNNKRWIHIDVSPTCNNVYSEVWSATRNDDGDDNRWDPWEYSTSFTAPTTPGSYNVCVRVRSYEDIGNNVKPSNPQGVRVLSQPYVVVSPAVNGICGSATSTAVDVAPTSNLCSAGTASAITGSGPWTWTCAGSNGGATSSVCTAPKKIVPGCTGSCSGNGSSSNISPITGSTYTPCGTAKVNLSWTNPTPVNTTYYKIYRDGSDTSFAVHNVTGEPTTVTAVVNSISGSHTYRVKACSSNTCTDTYSPATASVLSSNPCAGPGIDIVAEKKCDASNNKSILITVSADAGTTYSVTRNGLQIIANPGTQAYDSPVASGNYTYVMNATSSADGNPTSTDTATITNYSPGSCGAPINCSISSIHASKETNINSNTVWTASSSAAIASYNRTWTITDGGVVSTSTASVLNKIFTTIGLKTVALSLGTTTADGFYVSGNCSPVATTTIVFDGGINER